MADLPENEQDDSELQSAFKEAVEEGTLRLRRSWPSLLATGLVGGIDLSIGVIALLVIKDQTGSDILAALGFTTGFIALSLARSELFTENFFVPVAAVVAQTARVRDLIRLWLGTLIMNLIGGGIIMALLISAVPSLGQAAQETATFYTVIGIGWSSFALAMLGGAVITIMTWMERNSESQGPKIVGAVAASFVLAAVPLNHVIVSSLEMFAALATGSAPFGYLDYLGFAAWATLGNTLGGLVLVTLIRLVQVGRQPIEEERARASEERERVSKARDRQERFSRT